jgi:hypothetical protein
MPNQRAPRHPVLHLRIAQRNLNRSTRQSRMLPREILCTRALTILDGFNDSLVVILPDLQHSDSTGQL